MDARPFHVRGANEKRLWAYSGPSAPEPAAAPLPEGLRPGNGAMSTRKSRRPIRAKRRRATDT
jgi:hypothetical protein